MDDPLWYVGLSRMEYLRWIKKFIDCGMVRFAVEVSQKMGVQFTDQALNDMRASRRRHYVTYAVLVQENIVTPGNIVTERIIDGVTYDFVELKNR